MHIRVCHWLLPICFIIFVFGSARADDAVIQTLKEVKANIVANKLQSAVQQLNTLGHDGLKSAYLAIIRSYDFLDKQAAIQIPFEEIGDISQGLTGCDRGLHNECWTALWYFELAYSRLLICNRNKVLGSPPFTEHTPFEQLSSALNIMHYGRSSAVAILEEKDLYTDSERKSTAEQISLIDGLQRIIVPAAFWVLKFRHSRKVFPDAVTKREQSLNEDPIDRCLSDWASLYADQRIVNSYEGFGGTDGMTYAYVYLHLGGDTEILKLAGDGSQAEREKQTYLTMSKLIADTPVDVSDAEKLADIFCKLSFPFASKSELDRSPAFNACIRHYS